MGLRVSLLLASYDSAVGSAESMAAIAALAVSVALVVAATASLVASIVTCHSLSRIAVVASAS